MAASYSSYPSSLSYYSQYYYSSYYVSSSYESCFSLLHVHLRRLRIFPLRQHRLIIIRIRLRILHIRRSSRHLIFSSSSSSYHSAHFASSYVSSSSSYILLLLFRRRRRRHLPRRRRLLRFTLSYYAYSVYVSSSSSPY